MGLQAKRLEAVDDSLGPLGPLGDNFGGEASQADLPPAPPHKEKSANLNVRQTATTPQSPMSKSMMDSVDLEDDAESSPRARAPPVKQPEGARKQTQRSMSVEQAAKPTFDITVGDPHKVGDLTSSHIVYQVRTKVNQHIPMIG